MVSNEEEEEDGLFWVVVFLYVYVYKQKRMKLGEKKGKKKKKERLEGTIKTQTYPTKQVPFYCSLLQCHLPPFTLPLMCFFSLPSYLPFLSHF